MHKKFSETVIPDYVDKIEKIPIRTANQRIQDGLEQPDLNSLLGDVWQTGELAILFGGTGTGKTIFGVQIADAISKGESISVELKNECEPQVVLFLDFEMTDKQFQIRYTSKDVNKNTYPFSNNLKFLTISFGEIYEANQNITERIFSLINESIEQTKAKVLIIDNITSLSSKDSADGTVAMEIMSYLDKLKRTYSISILVMAHTPKKIAFTAITISDLSGSSKISNFSDCVFAIGKSIKSADFRYLIQTKFSRSKKEAFDSNHVLTLKKEMNHNFLKFEIEETTLEKEHLFADGEDFKLQAAILKNQGVTVRKIAEELNVSKSTISNWTKNS